MNDGLRQINSQLRWHPCPSCGRYMLEVKLLLEGLPLDSNSLSGDQLKVSAREWPYVVCVADTCDFRQRATLIDDQEGR